MNLTKKIFYIVSAIVATAFLPSCENYDDYMTDSIGYDGVYFPQSVLERSAIAGEGLSFTIGIIYGGVRENLADQTAYFEIDETLLEEYEDATYELLPSEYYTLSHDSEIVVPKGEISGSITITFDESIYDDPKFLDFNYALPLRLTDSTADIILEDFETCIYPVKMMNTYEGYYYQVGQQETYSTTPSWTYIDAETYGNINDFSVTTVNELITLAYNKVLYSAVAANVSSDYSFILTVNDDNSVSLEVADSDPLITEVTAGACTWDPTTRYFNLEYSYKTGGTLQYEVAEQLIFRNRIRDGLSEWRWDGFEGN